MTLPRFLVSQHNRYWAMYCPKKWYQLLIVPTALLLGFCLVDITIETITFSVDDTRSSHKTDEGEIIRSNVPPSAVVPEPLSDSEVTEAVYKLKDQSTPTEDQAEKKRWPTTISAFEGVFAESEVPNQLARLTTEKVEEDTPMIPMHPPFEINTTSKEVTWPWKNDTNCSRHSVRLGKNIPQILLTSFPRSGNTWLRYMLEGATGIFTGSVYTDERLISLGYLGEKEDIAAGTVLVIKDHRYGSEVKLNCTLPTVIIIRNPFRAIASFHAFSTGKRKTAFTRIGTDKNRSQKFVSSTVYKWERVASQAIKMAQYLHVVVYEQLTQNPLEEVKKILKFLRVPEDPDRLACLSRHSEGPVNRGQPEPDPYPAEQKKRISLAISRVSQMLMEKGLPPLPYT